MVVLVQMRLRFQSIVHKKTNIERKREKILGLFDNNCVRLEGGVSLHVFDGVIDITQVGVQHCFFCCDTFCRVALQHFLDQVKALLVKSWNQLRQGLLLEHLAILRVERQLCQANPVFWVGSASYLEDFLQLVSLVLAGKKRFTADDLSENASDGPDVDGGGVVLGAHQDIGRTVPQSHDLVRKVLHWDSEGTRQTEIGQLQHALSIDEQVLWLQVTMKHLVLMALCNSIEQLVQERLNKIKVCQTLHKV